MIYLLSYAPDLSIIRTPFDELVIDQTRLPKARYVSVDRDGVAYLTEVKTNPDLRTGRCVEVAKGFWSSILGRVDFDGESTWCDQYEIKDNRLHLVT